MAEFIAMATTELYPDAMGCELCTCYCYMRILSVGVQLGAFSEVCYCEVRSMEEGGRSHSKVVQDTKKMCKLGDEQCTFSITELQVPWDPGG